MIDLYSETVISLRDAAKSLPGRNGRKVHISTLYRWTTRGLKGVRLETVHVGGIVCTSQEALQRFCDRLSESDVTRPKHKEHPSRKRAIELAEQQLRDAGIE